MPPKLFLSDLELAQSDFPSLLPMRKTLDFLTEVAIYWAETVRWVRVEVEIGALQCLKMALLYSGSFFYSFH